MGKVVSGSKNPMFTDIMLQDTVEQGGRTCTYLGVFGKTLILVVIAIASAFIGIPLLGNAGLLGGFFVASLLLAFVFAIVGRLSVNLAPFCSIAYSVCEGIALGVLTALLELVFPGIGFAAIASTFAVVLVMAFLYMTGIVKASQKLKAFVITSLFAVLIVNLIIIIANLAGNAYLFELFYGNSMFGLIIAVLVAVVAALSLVLDFDYATRLVEGEAPKKYEWSASLGLMVGIVYLYIRILRILIIVFSRRN